MNTDLSVDHNRATMAEIRSHLADCDAEFMPRLSSRVDLDTYARKLFANAERFEAWDSAKLIGLIAIYCNDSASGRAYVTSVSVLPKHQGLGIASRLLQLGLEHVRQHGFRRVDLELDARNHAAARLYRRYGFAPVHTDGTSEIFRLTF